MHTIGILIIKAEPGDELFDFIDSLGFYDVLVFSY